MINIYTDVQFISNSKRTISLNSPYFELYTKHQPLTEQNLIAIKTIDKGELILGSDLIRTPFGAARIEDLSAGCNTALNILHHSNIIFDTIECGPNVIKLLCTFDSISFLCKNMLPFIEVQIPIMINNATPISSNGEYAD